MVCVFCSVKSSTFIMSLGYFFLQSFLICCLMTWYPRTIWHSDTWFPSLPSLGLASIVWKVASENQSMKMQKWQLKQSINKDCRHWGTMPMSVCDTNHLSHFSVKHWEYNDRWVSFCLQKKKNPHKTSTVMADKYHLYHLYHWANLTWKWLRTDLNADCTWKHIQYWEASQAQHDLIPALWSEADIKIYDTVEVRESC